MRIGFLVLLLSCLFASSVRPLPAEEAPQAKLPPIETATCVGGPAPLLEGKIAGMGADADGGRFYLLTRYPERLYVFRPSSLVPEAEFDARVEKPLVVVPEKGIYACTVPVENEEGFFTLSVFSLADGKPVRSSPKMSGEMLQLLYSPALSSFIGASATGEIIRWNFPLDEYRVIRKYEDIFSISLDASGRRVAVFSPNRFTDVLDAADGKVLVHDTSNSFRKVLLLGDGTKAVANTFGKGVRLVLLGEGKELFDFGGGAKVKDIALSADGGKLYISLIGGGLRAWDLSGEKPQAAGSAESVFRGGCLLLPAGEYLLTAEDYFFDIWNAGELAPIYASEHPKLFQSLALSPSGKFVMGVSKDRMFLYRLDGARLVPAGRKLILETSLFDVRAVRFYGDDKIWVVGALKCGWLDPSDFTFKKTFDFARPILSPPPRFCCGGKYMVVFRKNSEVAAFDIESGKQVLSFLPTTYLDEAAVSPDLSLVATRAVPLEIFRVGDRKRIFDMRKGLYDLTFSPDGRFLYGYNSDGVVVVDVEKRAVARTISVPGTVNRLIVGKKKALAFSNKGVYLLDLAAGEAVAGTPFADLDVRRADYRNGLCLFQSADSVIRILKADLDR